MNDFIGMTIFGFLIAMLVLVPICLYIIKKIITQPTPEERRSKFSVVKEKDNA